MLENSYLTAAPNNRVNCAHSLGTLTFYYDCRCPVLWPFFRASSPCHIEDDQLVRSKLPSSSIFLLLPPPQYHVVQASDDNSFHGRFACAFRKPPLHRFLHLRHSPAVSSLQRDAQRSSQGTQPCRVFGETYSFGDWPVAKTFVITT